MSEPVHETGSDTDRALLAVRAADLYYRYARAVDTGDLDALRELATEDVKITRGTNPTEEGIEAFLDVYRAHNAQQIPVCKHVISNVVAERVGEEVVTGAYFEATFLTEEETRVIIGNYDDIQVEVDGRLKLAHKKISVQRVLHLPPAGQTFVPAGTR